MAFRRLRTVAGGSEVRDRLAEKYRDLIEIYARPLADREGRLPASCPWPHRLAALEAGEPLEVAGWQINPVLPRRTPGRPEPNDWVVLEADGSLTPLGNPE